MSFIAFMYIQPINQCNYKISNSSIPDYSVSIKHSRVNLSNKDNSIQQYYKYPLILFGSRFNTNNFEIRFTRNFFKKLLRENISDAYTGKKMILREDVETLLKLGTFNKNASIVLKILKKFKDCLYRTEKNVFSVLERLSKTHPKFSLQKLLRLKYNKSEEILINQQSHILDKINLISRKLPKKDFEAVRTVVQQNFEKIIAQNPLPEERFSKKQFITELKHLELKDIRAKEKIIRLAEELPSSTDSIHAFIIKYSQPYKIKKSSKTGETYKTELTSEDIVLGLLEPSIGSVEHIHPQTKFFEEQEALKTGQVKPENVSTFRVSILTSKRINEVKSDTPIDSFIEQEGYQVIFYIYNHIDELIRVAEKWSSQGNIKDAKTLVDYIRVLKQEFDLRSDLVHIDLSDYEELLSTIEHSVDKPNIKRCDRIKKCGHADNSHREHFYNENNEAMENRKVHKHSAKFKK